MICEELFQFHEHRLKYPKIMDFFTHYIVRLDLNCDLTNSRKLLTVASLKSWPELHKIQRTYLKGHHNIDLEEYLVTVKTRSGLSLSTTL